MPLKAKQIGTGSDYIVLLDLNDEVWLAGRTFMLKRMPFQRTGLKAKLISVGDNTAAVIDLEDNLWIIGIGLENERAFVQLLGVKAQQVSAGNLSVMFIDFQQNLWGYGLNRHGKLGLGDERWRDTPEMVLGLKVQQVSVGRNHTAVIDLESNVWTFGHNAFGSLGLGFSEFRSVGTPQMISNFKAKYVSAGNMSTYFIAMDDTVWVTGTLGDDQPKYSVPTQISTIPAQMISASDIATLIDFDQNLWVRGRGDAGQLGMGRITRLPNFRKVPNLKALSMNTSKWATFVIGSQVQEELIDCSNGRCSPYFEEPTPSVSRPLSQLTLPLSEMDLYPSRLEWDSNRRDLQPSPVFSRMNLQTGRIIPQPGPSVSRMDLQPVPLTESQINEIISAIQPYKSEAEIQIFRNILSQIKLVPLRQAFEDLKRSILTNLVQR